jgi:hypothetical protein
MPTFFRTRTGELVNLGIVAQIEGVITTRGFALVFFDAAGQQLAAVAAPYNMPRGFIEVSSVPLFSQQPGNVRHVFVSLACIGRIALGPDGQQQIFNLAGHARGTVRAPLDLSQAGAVIVDAQAQRPAA